MQVYLSKISKSSKNANWNNKKRVEFEEILVVYIRLIALSAKKKQYSMFRDKN